MSLLITGGTGTLGRQVVRRALAEGYSVKCLVRNLRKAAFLKEWGVTLTYGDLKSPETIPQTLKGTTTVIDAATLRAVESSYTTEIIDWRGKVALIEASKQAKVKRFIFFSILNGRQATNVPLVNLKLKVEDYLIKSGLTYTIFRIPGFYQGFITQYAVPILEKQPIWTTGDTASVPYMDTQDIAKFALRSLTLEETQNKSFSLTGPKSWSSSEIISLCETLCGRQAEIKSIPIIGLALVKQILRSFEWSWNIADRLAFSEVLTQTDTVNVNSTEMYKTFGFNPDDTQKLEDYLQEYFKRILKKLKDMNYESKRQDISF